MTRVTLMLFGPIDGLDAGQRVARQRAQARIALAKCAALVGAPLNGWRQDDQDRPLPNAGFHFSIAHKRGCAVAAIADHPVGVDVERIKPRTSEHFDEVGSPTEWAVLGGRSARDFFRLWTAKEAVLKSTGLGMAGWDGCRISRTIDDRRLALTIDGTTVEVEHFARGGHIAAVTAHGVVEWTVLSPDDHAASNPKSGSSHAHRT
jgi:4'-phosphopantetheinyl transferase